MSTTKNNALLLSMAVLVTGLSLSSISQFPQIAHSQEDYEELIIVENNNEQKLKQENTGSSGSTNINCGTNVVAGNSPQQITTKCPSVPGETPTSDIEFTTTIVSNTARMEYPESRATAEVSCPDGTEVTGGGYDLRSESNVEVHQILNTPENLPTENGWRTTVQVNAVSDEVTLLLTVYAVCGTLVEPTTG